MAQARIFGYDLVRAVAIFFVVAVHCRVVVDTGSTIGNLWFLACGTLFFAGNALFFMMSGKFNLRVREGDAALKKFYRSKARNIIVPVLVYFLIRTVYDLWGNWQGMGHAAAYFVKGSLSDFASIEYWFVFTLVGFLLVAPFLARAFDGMSDFEVKVFIGIGIGFNTVLTVLDNAGIGFSWGYLFSGFGFAFCLGVLIERFASDPKVRRALKWAVLVCFVLNVAVQYAGFSLYAYETSPLYTIMAVGLYLALLDWGEKLPKFSFVSFVAKHSFGIYLCHMMVLLAIQKFFMFDQGLSTMGVHVLLSVVAFALSLAAAWLIDSTAVKGAKAVFDAAFGWFDKKKEADLC